MTQQDVNLGEVYRQRIGSMQLLWRIGPHFSRLFGRSGPTVADWLLVRRGGDIVAAGCEHERDKIAALEHFCHSARPALCDDLDDALLDYLVEWHWVEFAWTGAPARRPAGRGAGSTLVPAARWRSRAGGRLAVLQAVTAAAACVRMGGMRDC